MWTTIGNQLDSSEIIEGLFWPLGHIISHGQTKVVYMFMPQMNQLQSELRLARSLLAERETEIQRVRTTNDQVLPSSRSLCCPRCQVPIHDQKLLFGLKNYIFFVINNLIARLYCCADYNVNTVCTRERKTKSHLRWMEYPSSKGIFPSDS